MEMTRPAAETAAPPALDRRRPGRIEMVNPALIPLLRQDAVQPVSAHGASSFNFPRFAWTSAPAWPAPGQPSRILPQILAAPAEAEADPLRASQGILLAVVLSSLFWGGCFWIATLLG